MRPSRRLRPERAAFSCSAGQEFFYDLGDAAVVGVPFRDIVRLGLQRVGGVRHRASDSGGPDHRQIVLLIPDGDGPFDRYAQQGGETADRVAFRYAGTHTFEEPAVREEERERSAAARRGLGTESLQLRVILQVDEEKLDSLLPQRIRERGVDAVGDMDPARTSSSSAHTSVSDRL